MAALEYDMLYGDQIVYDGENPYEATNMTFGLYPITVTNVIRNEATENAYYIRGENFTTYSRVYVNGNQMETHFIDSNTLELIADDPLKVDDVINVWQSHLTCTEDYTYNVVEMIPVEEDQDSE